MLREPTVPDAMADPVLRRYRLRRLRLPLARGVLSMVVPDAGHHVRDGSWAEAAARHDEPPYWVQVWPASVAVARLLARLPTLAEQRVLDLGCGLGVPGVAAARCGATVTFVDRELDALAFASWNARRQGGPAPSALRLDWGSDTLATVFDVIVLADVSYRPVHHLALQRHVTHCLAHGGVVIHADPERVESTSFVRWLRAHAPSRQQHVRTSFLERTIDVRLCVSSGDSVRLASFAAAIPKTASTARSTAPSA
jgi:predicted nicotinamide N-methyase